MESEGLPPAGLTQLVVFQGYKYRWSHPGKSSFCNRCYPGVISLTTERKF